MAGGTGAAGLDQTRAESGVARLQIALLGDTEPPQHTVHLAANRCQQAIDIPLPRRPEVLEVEPIFGVEEDPVHYPEDRAESKPDAIHCRRTGQEFSPEEHQRCPYCFGTESIIEDGDHAEFCDYDPEKDPKQFGFPGDSTRDLRG